MDKTFDEIDNLFLDYFNENKEVPYSIQNTINHALDSEKKQNSLLEFIKALIITLIRIFTVTGGLVFARKMVNNFFTVNTGLDTAIEHGYIESVDSQYVESSNIKLKLNNFMMDDCNINFDFEILPNIDITNLEKIKFNNILIIDENNNILYSDNDDFIIKYCKDNNIIYDAEKYNKQFFSIGYNPYIKEKDNKSVNYICNLYSNNYPLSKEIKIIIKNMSFISDTTETIDGNWEINIKVPEKFYNRNSTDYHVTYCSDPSLNVLNAKLYDTCMKISFNLPITDKNYSKAIIDTLSSYVDTNNNYIEMQNGLKNFNNALNSDTTLNNQVLQFVKNSVTNPFIVNENEKEFYRTTSNDMENSYIIFPNNIFYIETFSLTKYEATNKLKLFINYNNKIIEIDLENN